MMAQKRTYRSKQSLYLRISQKSVLQMLLYLDQRHVFWMQDDILERVLLALKDRITIKLANEKKGKAKVDVYRGAGYQMAYFFRKHATKHSVLLKHKQVVFEDSQKTETNPLDMDQEPPPKRTKLSVDPLSNPIVTSGLISNSNSKDNPDTSLLQDENENDPFNLDIPMEQPILVKEEQIEQGIEDLLAPGDIQLPPELLLDDEPKPDIKPRLKPYPPLPASSPALTASATPAPTDARQLSATLSLRGSIPPLPRNEMPLFRSETPSERGETPIPFYLGEDEEVDDDGRAAIRASLEQEDEDLPGDDAIFKKPDWKQAPSLLKRASSGDKRVKFSSGNLEMDQFMSEKAKGKRRAVD